MPRSMPGREPLNENVSNGAAFSSKAVIITDLERKRTMYDQFYPSHT